jgi:hypothetical protein
MVGVEIELVTQVKYLISILLCSFLTTRSDVAVGAYHG